MKKSTIACMLVFMVITLCGFKSNVRQDEEAATTNEVSLDTTAPILETKVDGLNVIEENDSYRVVYVKNTKMDLTKYFDANDDSGTVHLASLGKINLSNEGIYDMVVIAVDNATNATSKTVKLEVITNEEYATREEAMREELRRQEAARKAEIARRKAAEIAYQKQLAVAGSSDLNAIADALLGMPGLCDQVASRFLELAYGYGGVRNSYPVAAGEARPGDIIFYSNNGFGGRHWAIYLGGDVALHGNFNGTTMYYKAYIPHMSTPQFRRLNGR